MRTAGRAGFVARGVVYVLIGVLALEIAFGKGRAEADRQGALHQVAAQPFGLVMLWVLVVGFGCMTLRRASLAVLGEGGQKKTGSRVLSAGRAVFYASVCWGTAAYAAGSGGQSGGDAKSRDWTASTLKLPGGQVLVVIAGVVLFGVGVGIAVGAIRRTFLKKLDTAAMSARTRSVVTAMGLGGNTASHDVGGPVDAQVDPAGTDPDRPQRGHPTGQQTRPPAVAVREQSRWISGQVVPAAGRDRSRSLPAEHGGPRAGRGEGLRGRACE